MKLNLYQLILGILGTGLLFSAILGILKLTLILLAGGTAQ